MKVYEINEIFSSIQGEGDWVGRPCVFIRFSGCNLNCEWCDTDHSDINRMTLGEIVDTANMHKPIPQNSSTYLILTGGEPMLQLDSDLLLALHQKFDFIGLETNGTIPIDQKILINENFSSAVRIPLHITVSPKLGTKWVYINSNAVKVVDEGQSLQQYKDFYGWGPTYYLQPKHIEGMSQEEFQETMRITAIRVFNNPGWRLSLQTHKIIGVK